MYKNLRAQFEYIEKSFGDSPAICFKDRSISYKELGEISNLIAKGFMYSESKYCVVLGNSSLPVFAGIFSAFKNNKTFVPLDSSTTQDMLLSIINSGKMDLILISKDCLDLLPALNRVYHALTIILLDFSVEDISNRIYIELDKNHKLYQMSDLENIPTILVTTKEKDNSSIYLMFTSGSTGTPKGVEINETNLNDFIKNINELWGISNESRFSHISPLSFDFSIYEYFIPCLFGASVYVYNKLDYQSLGEFIIQSNISHWASVPTTMLYMLNSKQFSNVQYPSIQVSLIGGEALPSILAKEWKNVAINTKIYNGYGPTEATVFISSYLWNENNLSSNDSSIVPIGKVFPDNIFCIGHPSKERLKKGPLWISGKQVIKQYWLLENEHKFYAENGNVWYNTGDIVQIDETGVLHYVGREDDQIQIQGHRVEKLEIEVALKKGLKIELLALLPHKNNSLLIDGFTLFIDDSYSPLSVIALKKKCKMILKYSWIKEIIFLPIPVNKNNKIDYLSLSKLMKEEL